MLYIYLVSTNLYQAVVIAEGAAEALHLCGRPEAGDATIAKLGRTMKGGPRSQPERVRIVLWSQR